MAFTSYGRHKMSKLNIRLSQYCLLSINLWEVLTTTISIVFVHGLAGGSISSFVHENGAFWPDWLASDLPNTRIFSFGYAANDVYLKNSDQSSKRYGRVFTFAEQLCGALRDARVHSGTPITFIGHGVGGIVIKSALAYSNARRLLFGNLVRDTRHIVFFDTPHRGCDLSTWRAIYGEAGNEHAHTQFGYWSIILAELSRTFSDIGNQVHITSCYASEPTIRPDGSYVLVQESSVSLDYVHEILLHLPNVSHTSMCKFPDPTNSNYCTIRDRLSAEQSLSLRYMEDVDEEKAVLHYTGSTKQKLMEETTLQLQDIKEQLVASDAKLDMIHSDQKVGAVNFTKNDKERVVAEHRKLRRKVLKWLYAPKKGIDHEADLSMRDQGDEDTCSWVLQHPELIAWQCSTKSHLLWLHGIQGCGKSTLVSWLIRNLFHDFENVFYFYCTAEVSPSGTYALGCLAHQMVARLNLVPEPVISRYERSTYATVASVHTAKTILKEVIQTYKSCYIFIDALDECLDRKSLIEALIEITRDSVTNIKVLCSSRDELDIQRMFRSKNSVYEVQMSSENIQQAINLFIRKSLRKSLDLTEKLEGHPDTYHFMLSQLEATSQGMFLLPKFMIQDLELKSTVEEIVNFFNDLPSGLHAYYIRILEKIELAWHSLARDVITWAVWAKRPITLDELQEVLTLGGPKRLGLRGDIKKALGCLVSLEGDCVRLSHSSIKRFLLESKELRSHRLYNSFIIIDPPTFLAETCTRFLFSSNRSWRPHSGGRLLPRKLAQDLIRSCSPFMEYASVHWLYHCRESRRPLEFIHSVRQLLESPHFLKWYEALAAFIRDETPTYFFHNFQSWISELELRVSVKGITSEMSNAQHELLVTDLAYMSGKLSKIWDFLEHWDYAVVTFPGELCYLAPLIDSPNALGERDGQFTLLTSPGRGVDAHRRYNLLDRRYLGWGFDRFMLSDQNVFMWQSLMPCTAADCAGIVSLNASKPATINLRVESIERGLFSERHGIDPAEVGSITNTAILRKDLRAIAIVWARYSEDKSRPLEVKSYAWNLGEDKTSYYLRRIEWTDLEDPCRVDLTVSNCFRMSKGAVAFSQDLRTVWTPGGGYDLESGSRKPAPIFFYDDDISALTFSRNASAIAGVRQDKGVEFYDIPSCQKVAVWSGNCSLLGLSPYGSFVLFIDTVENQDLKGTKTQEQRVCLLSRNGNCSIIWTFKQKSDIESNETEVQSLAYFYNNGGLQAFSENETILAIFVPESPEWALLAFDLTVPDIASSRWNIDYSVLLTGASIMSFSFCPLHERRLYVLDSFGFMRALEISRKSSAPSIKTLKATSISPALTATSIGSNAILVASLIEWVSTVSARVADVIDQS